MKTNTGKNATIKLAILTLFASLTQQVFAGDLDAFSLMNIEEKKGTPGFTGTEEDGKLKIEPKVSASEGNNLSPALTFTTRKKVTQASKAYLGLTASSKPSLEEPIELAKSYVVDGGDINFNLGWVTLATLVSKSKSLYFDINTGYSLYSGDEFSTEENSTLEIETEIVRFGAGLYYDFNAAKLSYSVNHHNVNNEKTASEFSKLIDGKISQSIGIAIPFETDNKKVYLKFLRTEIEDLNSPDFRVSIELSL